MPKHDASTWRRVLQFTELGYPDYVWRRQTVPGIDDTFLDCAIYLYRTKEEAKRGIRIGGSGFLVAVITPVYHHIYAVTNSHVIYGEDGSGTDGAPIIRLNTKEGRKDVIPRRRDDWIHHPDGHDIAVTRIEPPRGVYRMMALNRGIAFLDEYIIYDKQIGPGDDTFIVGRFINHEGKQLNRPTVRFGHLSMMASEVDKLLQKNRVFLDERLGFVKRDFEQESFLVECHSIGGYSGSPVFVYAMPSKIRKLKFDAEEGDFPLIGPYLLGIDWGHILNTGAATMGAIVNTGMMTVVPAWHLDSLLNSTEVKMQRDKVDEQHRPNVVIEEATTELDSAMPEDEGITPEAMQEAFRRASRKTSQPDSESDET